MNTSYNTIARVCEKWEKERNLQPEFARAFRKTATDLCQRIVSAIGEEIKSVPLTDMDKQDLLDRLQRFSQES